MKTVFTAFLFDAQYESNGVEKKVESLLVVALVGALIELPPFLCGRQVSESRSLPVVMVHSGKMFAKRHKLLCRGEVPQVYALSTYLKYKAGPYIPSNTTTRFPSK